MSTHPQTLASPPAPSSVPERTNPAYLGRRFAAMATALSELTARDRATLEPDILAEQLAHEARVGAEVLALGTIPSPTAALTIVGWHFNHGAFAADYCLDHKPAPPQDEHCEAIRFGDVDDETCESCGVPLILSPVEREMWHERENTRAGERVDGRLWAQVEPEYFARND